MERTQSRAGAALANLLTRPYQTTTTHSAQALLQSATMRHASEDLFPSPAIPTLLSIAAIATQACLKLMLVLHVAPRLSRPRDLRPAVSTRQSQPRQRRSSVALSIRLCRTLTKLPLSLQSSIVQASPLLRDRSIRLMATGLLRGTASLTLQWTRGDVHRPLATSTDCLAPLHRATTACLPRDTATSNQSIPTPPNPIISPPLNLPQTPSASTASLLLPDLASVQPTLKQTLWLNSRR